VPGSIPSKAFTIREQWREATHAPSSPLLITTAAATNIFSARRLAERAEIGGAPRRPVGADLAPDFRSARGGEAGQGVIHRMSAVARGGLSNNH